MRGACQYHSAARGTCALLPAKWARGAAVYLAPPQRPNIAAAPSTAPRDTYSVLTAPPPLAWGNKAPDARSEAAAHCGNPGTGVPRARSSPRVTAALLVRRRQAHRGSGAPLLFATTGCVPREQFRAHQWRRKQRTEWTSAGGWTRMGNCRALLLDLLVIRSLSQTTELLRSRWGHTTSSTIAMH